MNEGSGELEAEVVGGNLAGVRRPNGTLKGRVPPKAG